MELKLATQRIDFIVYLPSNRTSLELKPVVIWNSLHPRFASNRTSLELKRVVLLYSASFLSVTSSNRTSLELKPYAYFSIEGRGRVELLIEPVWN